MHDVMEWLPLGMIGVIAYFLRTLHSDIKKNVQEIASLKTEVTVIKSESNSKIENLTSTTEIQIQNLTKAVEDLADVSRKILLKIQSEN